MTNKEQAKVVRDIADEIEAKGWYNERLRIGVDDQEFRHGVCPLFTEVYDRVGAANLRKAIGVESPYNVIRWNDSHDNVESLLGDLRARADFLDAAPDAVNS